MNIAIVFATYSGGTRIAAHTIARVLQEHHKVTVHELTSKDTPPLHTYDVIILGSPSWLDEKGVEGRPHKWLIHFMETQKEAIKGKRCAIFALGDWYYGHFAGAGDYLKEFVQLNGAELIGEVLRINKFQFFLTESEQRCLAWAQNLNRLLS